MYLFLMQLSRQLKRRTYLRLQSSSNRLYAVNDFAEVVELVDTLP
jgi:hypothetical protein